MATPNKLQKDDFINFGNVQLHDIKLFGGEKLFTSYQLMRNVFKAISFKIQKSII